MKQSKTEIRKELLKQATTELENAYFESYDSLMKQGFNLGISYAIITLRKIGAEYGIKDLDEEETDE